MNYSKLLSRILSFLLIVIINPTFASGTPPSKTIVLDSLSIVNESLDQSFQSNLSSYTATVGFLAQSVKLRATTPTVGSTITVNDINIDSNNTSHLISLNEGINTDITIVVTKDSTSKKTNNKKTISATYALKITRNTASDFAQQAYIKASNTDANDRFGISVSLSGYTLAVGAPQEDSSTTGINSTPDNLAAEAGAVYVFTRSGTTWTQQAYIKASNTDAYDLFGTTVALSGDTLAISAYGEASSSSGINSTPNNLTPYAGAVYIYTRTGNTWSQQDYIKASNPDSYDGFGASLVLVGDTLVVGANNESSSSTGINSIPDNLAPNSGAVYVYSRSGVTWTQQAYIKASNTDANDRFGVSLALSKDTLAVGAFGEASNSTGINSTPNNLASFAGAVYIFTRSGIEWTQQAYLKASNSDASDAFGVGVALSGDMLAVGADGEDSSSTGINSIPDKLAPRAGAVYIFSRNGTTWSQQTYIKASNTDAHDHFGNSVALSDNILAVGAVLEDSNSIGINSTPDTLAPAAGAAYVYVRDGEIWTQKAYIKASNTDTNTLFGIVSLTGNSLAIGSYGENSNSTGVNSVPDTLAPDAGAVYVFK